MSGDDSLTLRLAQALLEQVRELRAASYTVENGRGECRETSPSIFRQVQQFLAHYTGSTGDGVAELWADLHTELRMYVEWVLENSSMPAAFDVARRYVHDPVALVSPGAQARSQRTLTAEEAGVVSALRLVRATPSEKENEDGVDRLQPAETRHAPRQVAGG